MHSLAGAPKLLIALAAYAGIVVVGLIDYVTGIEVRVFPLYFLPLMLSTSAGRLNAICASLFAACVWVVAMYLSGRQYSHSLIWVINFVTHCSCFVIVVLLVTTLRKALVRERALSEIDALTGMANRRSFTERATSVLALCHRHERPATLAYFDLDNFKHANDSQGHHYGDELLRSFSRIITEGLRSSDVAGRIGGDEFVALLPECTAESAPLVLEKIRARVAEHPDFRLCSVTVSIGAVTFTPAPTELSEMLRSADRVMYQVKAASKNDVLIEEHSSGERTQTDGQATVAAIH
ncbi:MAG: GGDEF domain-containing protein [Bradymonadaceae bacterium]|nr:GGDEF domain-containing protein [Lujinxingiaceae bacterium]